MILYFSSLVGLIIVGGMSSCLDPTDRYIKKKDGEVLNENTLYCQICRTIVSDNARHCKICNMYVLFYLDVCKVLIIIVFGLIIVLVHKIIEHFFWWFFLFGVILHYLKHQLFYFGVKGGGNSMLGVWLHLGLLDLLFLFFGFWLLDLSLFISFWYVTNLQLISIWWVTRRQELLLNLLLYSRVCRDLRILWCKIQLLWKLLLSSLTHSKVILRRRTKSRKNKNH